ncbi:MAG: hypothetical protein ACKO3G_01970, partial [Planctomycetaceae bacterium]
MGLLADRGQESSLAINIKAHTSDEQVLVGLVTNPGLREGNARADLGANVALTEHEPQLAVLGRLLAQRGSVYVRFLSELA